MSAKNGAVIVTTLRREYNYILRRG